VEGNIVIGIRRYGHQGTIWFNANETMQCSFQLDLRDELFGFTGQDLAYNVRVEKRVLY
jgi:hypothetical protein